MQWYVVKKHIKGNYYWYWQKTYRVGRHVKTLNKYIGPAHRVSPPFGPPSQVSIIRPVQLPPATTIPIPFPETVRARVDALTLSRVLDVVTKHGPSDKEMDLAWDRSKFTRHQNWRKFEKVESVYKNLGIDVRNYGDGNYYNPAEDWINIVHEEYWYATPDSTVEYRYYRTRCHELVHWTGGRKRLNRINFACWGDESYVLEELTAELGACMLMQILGYAEGESTDFHTEYFQHWLQRAGDKDEAIKKATERAKDAVEYILTNGGIL